MDGYELLDSGHGRKLERFGEITLIRPCAQAVWAPQHPGRWKQATARFDREGGLNWHSREKLPDQWVVTINGIRLRLSSTDFGHLGVFPETRAMWDWIGSAIARARKRREVSFLNLFAYSGGATLAAARAGAEACHLDASKGMVNWARENAKLNRLDQSPIRWIVEDANKFLGREARRGRTYDAVLLDPPSFGRGRGGELYKIEKDLMETLANVKAVLSDQPLFVILTSHTPGFSPIVLSHLLSQHFGPGAVESGEMLLTGSDDIFPVPSGNWARWLG
jgi:23S rRNA (cytosine1962-C5)-methyltransferase